MAKVTFGPLPFGRIPAAGEGRGGAGPAISSIDVPEEAKADPLAVPDFSVVRFFSLQCRLRRFLVLRVSCWAGGSLGAETRRRCYPMLVDQAGFVVKWHTAAAFCNKGCPSPELTAVRSESC